VKPDDDLAAILESRAPGIDVQTLDSSFRSPTLKWMMHLVINAILYATSVSEAWPLVPSPARALEAKVRDLGDKRKKRAATRAADLRKAHSSESVFYLPGSAPPQGRRLSFAGPCASAPPSCTRRRFDLY
jgi:hypothetical protein